MSRSKSVRRKPPPVHRSSSTLLQASKLSFSERYPDPDPTDPFAPLWVLRSRTSSVLQREGPVSGLRQPDRRRSLSYFETPKETCTKLQRTRSIDAPSHNRTVSAASGLPLEPSLPTPPEADSAPSVSATVASSATVRRSASRPVSKLSLPLPDSPFPTLHSLTITASLPIIAESGVRIPFGSLFAQQKTIVLFIRHFWCPACQDYMSSVAALTRQLAPGAISSPADGQQQDEKFDHIEGDSGHGRPVKLVVIGSGPYTMIGKYKQIFGRGAIPLDVYTDPSLAVYTALGMRKTPLSQLLSHSRSKSSGLDRSVARKTSGISCLGGGIDREKTKNNCGGYVRHGLMGGIAMVLVRAFKVGMPVWEKGGNLAQLGGEFVLGPGLQCTYAHTMQTFQDHAPFEDVLRAADVTIPTPPPSTKEDKRLEKYDQARKYKPLRKSRPSIGYPIAQVTPSARAHTRGQTVDVVSAEVHLAFTVPTSVSTPQFPFKISQVMDSDKGQIQRRNSARMSTVGVLSDMGPLVTAGLVVPSKASQLTLTDNQVGPMSSVPLHPPEQAISHTRPATPDLMMMMMMTKNNNNRIPVLETQPTEDRHRSLQKIKERKRNASRGLSQFDERHVGTGSMSLDKPALDARTTRSRPSYSRSSSNSLPGHSSLSLCRSVEPVSRSLTLSSQIRYHGVSMERTRSSRLARRTERRRNGSISSADERAVHSDSGMIVIKRGRNARKPGGGGGGNLCEGLGHDDDDDDDDVLPGREKRKINLSRDYLVRRESRKVQNNGS